MEVFRIEAGGVPFALDGIHGAAARGDDEIKLVLVFVAPIHDLVQTDFTFGRTKRRQRDPGSTLVPSVGFGVPSKRTFLRVRIGCRVLLLNSSP